MKAPMRKTRGSKPIETTNNEHWQDVRERAAIAVLQGFLTDWDPEWSPNDYAKRAVIYADELVEELKKK